MEIFAQNKRLKIFVMILALLNLATIGTFIWKDFISRPKEKSEDAKEISSVLKKKLNLSESQAEKIKNLRAEFFEKEKVLAESIRGERDSLNAVMFNKNTDEELTKSIARRIAENQYSMELLRVEQAMKFKSICTPEQLEKFEGLVKEIRDYFKPDDRNKGKQNKKDDKRRD